MLLFTSVLFLLTAEIQSNPLADRQRTVEQSESALANANNDFSFKMFKTLSKEDNNDVLSSFSIISAFSILMNGAESETLNEMRRFLEYENTSNNSRSLTESSINEAFKTLMEKYKEISKEKVRNPNQEYDFEEPSPVQLLINNRLIQDNTFEVLPHFEQRIKTYFNASVQKADFGHNSVEETKKVNDWISNVTNHKITKIFDKIPETTSFVILNALYFKGNWFDEFSKTATKKEDFYNNGVTPVKTDMMHQSKFRLYSESQELDAEFLEMIYYGQGFSKSNLTFIIALPKQKNGLNNLKQKLNAQNFGNVMESLKREEVILSVPKFRIESEYDLMRDITPLPQFLSTALKLSRMTSRPQVIAEIKHKVFIAIDEKGTEAAAVTALRGVGTSLVKVPRQINFKVDHPFLFFIRDKSNGMILFSGQINNL